MATKPVPPQLPTDAELNAVGEVALEEAPLDTLPMTEEERWLIDEAAANYARTGVTFTGEQVTALLEAKRRH